MAKQLPAFGSFPDGVGTLLARAGEGHHDQDVKDIVEGQHHACAYFGRQLIPCQYWPAQRLRVTSASYTRVLVWPVMPRQHMVGMTWRFRVNSDGGGDLRVRIADIPQNTDTNIAAAGQQRGSNTDGAVNRADTVTHVEVWLKRAEGGTYIDLLEFELRDDNLAAGSLP